MSPNNEILLELGKELHFFMAKKSSIDFDDLSMQQGQVIHPLLFWSLTTETPNLKEIALRIFRMPSSAAGGILFYNLNILLKILITIIGERNFKSRNYIHSKVRVK